MAAASATADRSWVPLLQAASHAWGYRLPDSDRRKYNFETRFTHNEGIAYHQGATDPLMRLGSMPSGDHPPYTYEGSFAIDLTDEKLRIAKTLLPDDVNGFFRVVKEALLKDENPTDAAQAYHTIAVKVWNLYRRILDMSSSSDELSRIQDFAKVASRMLEYYIRAIEAASKGIIIFNTDDGFEPFDTVIDEASSDRESGKRSRSPGETPSPTLAPQSRAAAGKASPASSGSAAAAGSDAASPGRTSASPEFSTPGSLRSSGNISPVPSLSPDGSVSSDLERAFVHVVV